MPNYRSAQPGYKFVLTTKGFEVARVRVKFEVNHPLFSRYSKCVPLKWITDGYVVEVKEE